jgi:hypothetical protein
LRLGRTISRCSVGKSSMLFGEVRLNVLNCTQDSENY